MISKNAIQNYQKSCTSRQLEKEKRYIGSTNFMGIASLKGSCDKKCCAVNGTASERLNCYFKCTVVDGSCCNLQSRYSSGWCSIVTKHAQSNRSKFVPIEIYYSPNQMLTRIQTVLSIFRKFLPPEVPSGFLPEVTVTGSGTNVRDTRMARQRVLIPFPPKVSPGGLNEWPEVH